MIYEVHTAYAECDGCGEEIYSSDSDYILSDVANWLKKDGGIAIEEPALDGTEQYLAFCPDCVATGAVKAFYLRENKHRLQKHN